MTSLPDISVSLGEELEKTARESKARAIAVALLGAIASSLSRAVLVRPVGSREGETDDHLHLDLGFVSLTPRQCSETS